MINMSHWIYVLIERINENSHVIISERDLSVGLMLGQNIDSCRQLLVPCRRTRRTVTIECILSSLWRPIMSHEVDKMCLLYSQAQTLPALPAPFTEQFSFLFSRGLFFALARFLSCSLSFSWFVRSFLSIILVFLWLFCVTLAFLLVVACFLSFLSQFFLFFSSFFSFSACIFELFATSFHFLTFLWSFFLLFCHFSIDFFYCQYFPLFWFGFLFFISFFSSSHNFFFLSLIFLLSKFFIFSICLHSSGSSLIFLLFSCFFQHETRKNVSIQWSGQFYLQFSVHFIHLTLPYHFAHPKFVSSLSL